MPEAELPLVDEILVIYEYVAYKKPELYHRVYQRVNRTAAAHSQGDPRPRADPALVRDSV